MFLSIVIPAYNEVENLPALFAKMDEVLQRCPDITDYEILVVDDHSADATLDQIRAMGNPKIQCLRLSRRSGSHTALRAGIAAASGDCCLCISADGQDDSSVLDQMLGKLKNGTHVVWGCWKKREEPFLTKLFAGFAYAVIIRFSGASSSGIDLAKANFFLLSRRMMDAVNACKEKNTSLMGLLLWLGFKQDFVEYDRKDRAHGKSKWSFRSRMRLFTDWIIAFSGIPLKLISITGFFTAALGFLYAAFIVVYTLLGYAKPGWAETAVLVLVLGGLQMMMLGILGEYLWRNLDETRKRPLYFIESETEGIAAGSPLNVKKSYES